MRALAVIASVALAADVAHTSRPSPDGRWQATWHCDRAFAPAACTVTVSRRADSHVFFTHQANGRYIDAVWSGDSSRCVLLDAPDNANTALWLFRAQGREITTEKLSYEQISKAIEVAVPAARPRDRALTRSGVEKMGWRSSSELVLHVIYNNVPVTVALDTTSTNSPKIRVSSE